MSHFSVLGASSGDNGRNLYHYVHTDLYGWPFQQARNFGVDPARGRVRDSNMIVGVCINEGAPKEKYKY